MGIFFADGVRCRYWRGRTWGPLNLLVWIALSNDVYKDIPQVGVVHLVAYSTRQGLFKWMLQAAGRISLSMLIDIQCRNDQGVNLKSTLSQARSTTVATHVCSARAVSAGHIPRMHPRNIGTRGCSMCGAWVCRGMSGAVRLSM